MDSAVVPTVHTYGANGSGARASGFSVGELNVLVSGYGEESNDAALTLARRLAIAAVTPAKRTRLTAFTRRVLIRIHERQPERLFLMNHPERGWASGCEERTWEWLSTLDGWAFAEHHLDRHSGGFWLEATGPVQHGVWGRSSTGGAHV